MPAEIEAYLLFCNHILGVFQETIKTVESNETTSLDIFKIMSDLKGNIVSRNDNKFYGFETKQKLKKLCVKTQTRLEAEFNSFYEKSLSYLESHFDFSQENWLAQISPLNLKTVFPKYDDFEKIFLKIDNPNLDLNMDLLFNEVASLSQHYNILMQGLPDVRPVEKILVNRTSENPVFC